MTNGGFGNPFGGDPFGAPDASPGFTPPAVQPGYQPAAPGGFGFPQSGFGAPQPQGFGAPQPPPQAPANTLATLSLVFAFVFAPVGAALGHIALSQIKRTQEPGRERAVIGIVVSYVLIALAVIALIVWLVTGGNSGSGRTATGSSSATSAAVSSPVAAPPPITTVITPPPVSRHPVTVPELRVGDCVEVQEEYRHKDDPNRSQITIYRVACEVRDGVVQVQQVLSTSTCNTTNTLMNTEHTIFACITDFKG